MPDRRLRTGLSTEVGDLQTQEKYFPLRHPESGTTVRHPDVVPDLDIAVRHDAAFVANCSGAAGIITVSVDPAA